MKQSTDKKPAFTLAEVLITLGIIGVVAAMTLPSLMQKYRKKVAETRLAQFYSVMSEAIKHSEIDNGELLSWLPNPVTNYSIEDYYNNYLAPYLKSSKTELSNSNTLIVYFVNGSIMTISNLNGISSPHINFYPFGKIINDSKKNGTYIFEFLIPYANDEEKNHCLYTRGFQPYSWIQGTWDNMTPEEINEKIYNNCKNLDAGFCTVMIMRNGWKIPDDYPHKF